MPHAHEPGWPRPPAMVTEPHSRAIDASSASETCPPPVRDQDGGHEERGRPGREDRDGLNVLVVVEVGRVAQRVDGGAGGEPLRDDRERAREQRGATAPPDELLPRTTKKSQLGRIAQRPTRNTISVANEATATMWSERMPHVSRKGSWSRSRSGPSTKVKTSAAVTARPRTKATVWRSSRAPACACTWKTVMKPTIVATSMR